MSWILSLSVASGGVGAAKLGAAGVPEKVGFFPTADRAMAFAASGESGGKPDAVRLLVPSTLNDQDLRWYLGEIVIAGVPAEKTHVRTIPDVLAEAYGGRPLLVDASWKKIVTADGGVQDLEAERISELHAEQPPGTTVILAGHPEEREKVHAATTELAPVLLEYPQIAALNLEQQAGAPPQPEESPGQDAPRQPAPAPRMSSAVRIALLLVAVVVLVLILAFLV